MPLARRALLLAAVAAALPLPAWAMMTRIMATWRIRAANAYAPMIFQSNIHDVFKILA